MKQWPTTCELDPLETGGKGKDHQGWNSYHGVVVVEVMTRRIRTIVGRTLLEPSHQTRIIILLGFRVALNVGRYEALVRTVVVIIGKPWLLLPRSQFPVYGAGILHACPGRGGWFVHCMVGILRRNLYGRLTYRLRN